MQPRALRPVARADAASAPSTLPHAIRQFPPHQLAGFLMDGGIGIVRCCVGTGIVWANASFVGMSGYTREAIEARSLDWPAMTPPEWHAEDRARLAAARVAGYSATYEKELLRADGSRWPVIVGYAVDRQVPETVTIFIVDLTASKIADGARAAADQRYARFFEVSNVAFWTSDAHGRATLTSATTAERLGTDEVLDDAVAQAELIHPDDRDFAIATWRAALASGEAYDIEVRARGLDGTAHRWTRLQAFPDRDAQGNVIGWYGTSEDIHERRLATIALTESEVRFKNLADDMPAMVWLTDEVGRTTYLSRRWYDFTGQTEAEALDMGWLRAILPDDLTRLASLQMIPDAEEAFQIDFRVRGADGEARWMMSSGKSRRTADGTLLGYVGSLTDIHARKMAERDLAETQMRLSRALDGTGVGVWEWDAATDTVSISGSAMSISGFRNTNAEYKVIDYRATIHPDDRERLLAAMAAYVEGRSEDFEVEVRCRTRKGGWVWVLDRGTATARDADGRATHMVGTLTNIEDSKRAEAKLRWTVDHDALTGLANRTLFHARLDTALAAGGNCALALLDIDDFKAVNDVHGHGAGDALLRVLADRLRDFTSPGETVARLGGDEFTLIIPACGDAAHVATRLERLRRSLERPFEHDGQTFTCRSSIGVAIAPGDGLDASTLLKSADIAMYSAKHAGRGVVSIFEPSLGSRAAVEVSRVEALRTALADGRIAPCYEPIVRLADGSVAGYEAAGHIVGGDGTIIDAHDFDGIAGHAELAVRLGTLLLERVVADFAAWRGAGVAPEFISINVSLPELRRADYAMRLLAALATHDIPSDRLRIEIVEAGLAGGRGADRSEANLAALSRGGVQVGLDRFGTGSASLSHLTRLTLAAIKIDAQFVRGVVAAGSAQTVVRAVIGLAQSFGLRSIALGVETAEQAAKLHDMGCTYGQGRFHGLPLDSAATLAALRERS